MKQDLFSAKTTLAPTVSGAIDSSADANRSLGQPELAHLDVDPRTAR